MATLNKHRYHLDKSSRKFRCPACEKKRFVRYIDQDGRYLPDDIGRCDREIQCEYHKPPREADGIELSNRLYSPPKQEKTATAIHYLPEYVLKASKRNYEANTFVKWMSTLPGWDFERAEAASRLYRVGTGSKDVHGWAIFWQIDEKEKIRSGKLMKYDQTGHRVKDGYSQDWIHSKMKKAELLENFELVQCFFGLHIVDDSKPIAICEAEKTAIIASQYLSQFYWIAAGQLHGINQHKLKPLRGKSITLFPDIGAFDLWTEKAEEYSGMANIQVSDLLETKAPDEHKGYDLADYLTQFDIRDFSPHRYNPYTNEIFDKRGYPRDWDDVKAPETGTDEHRRMEYEEALSRDEILQEIDRIFKPTLS